MTQEPLRVSVHLEHAAAVQQEVPVYTHAQLRNVVALQQTGVLAHCGEYPKE